jgi:hypothetical protein
VIALGYKLSSEEQSATELVRYAQNPGSRLARDRGASVEKAIEIIRLL